jgi:uncharacterized protein YecA (UPF0149 family)
MMKAGGINRPKTREIVESWKSMTPAVMVLEDVKEGMYSSKIVLPPASGRKKIPQMPRLKTPMSFVCLSSSARKHGKSLNHGKA